MQSILENFLVNFVDFIWGTPLLMLILGGGAYFTLYSRFLPFKHLFHGVNVLRGKYDNKNDPGLISHFQALSSALASTVGMGNISGVAVALHLGGAGAIFWMWISALFGMATKFFTCTLSIMYREKDNEGKLQGGPMYVISKGMGPKFLPLSILFSFAGLFGCLSLFQINQLTQVFTDELENSNSFLIPLSAKISYHLSNLVNFGFNDLFSIKIIIGIISAFIVGIITFGGIKRIGFFSSRLVPIMVLIYFIFGLFIIVKNLNFVPLILYTIVTEALSADAMTGGITGSVIIIGIKRAAFSNEAGIGTEVLAHGAAKTNEPVREGMVAMLGPLIDTIIVCTITALIILLSGVDLSEANGITLTRNAFIEESGFLGQYFLLFFVFIFSLTTMIGYSYYGTKCSVFLFGRSSKNIYRYIYIFSIVIGSIASLDMIINFLDSMFAIMAIPTMISSIYLSPRVIEETKRYFKLYN